MAQLLQPAKILFWLAVLLVSMAVSINAADSDEKPSPSSLNLHQWGAVTLFHGLPSNHVRAIVQDNEGVLWFGTDGGLAKYDGRRTQKVDDGLPGGRVRALKVDTSGTLWVGTDLGAARFINGHFNPVTETVGVPITAIAMPAAGQTVLVSEEGAIFFCSLSADVLAVRKIGPENNPLLKTVVSGKSAPLPLTSVAVTKDGLVIGTHGRGLLVVQGSEVREVLSRPRPYFINTLALDAQGHAWFGAETSNAESGLYESSEWLHPEKISVATGTVTALCFTSQDQLWAGSIAQGVFHYRNNQEVKHFTFENSAGGLRSNSVYAVFVDREGVVWFGTDRGVCRYDPNSPHAERIVDHRESNFVRALFQSHDGRLWCGTNRGLFTKESLSAAWQPVDILGNKIIHSIAEDQNGHLLVGSANGLYISTNVTTATASQRFVAIDKRTDESMAGYSVRAVCQFRGATYIATYGRGIERLDAEGRVLIWPLNNGDIRAREVISLYAERDERLWIGTASAEVFVYDGEQVRNDTALADLKNSTVWSIAGTMGEGLWFATGRGLYHYHWGKVAQVLKGSDVRAVIVAGSPDTIWCATNGNGLLKIAIDEWGRKIVSRLDNEHGLPSDNLFALLSLSIPQNKQMLWLATNRGTVYYQPGEISPVLRATRILGKSAYQPEKLPAGLYLEYPQNSLLLDVTATSSRTFPEQFQYSFLLFDAAGKIIDQKLSRDSQYLMENLRAGNYQVEARAYTNDLIASEPLVFRFQVASAPFPRTTVALSVLLALALCALWWGYHQNSKLASTNLALGQANQQLAETRMQLASETENERRRISRDLHDQTLSDLRQLLLLTDQLPIDNGNNTIDRTRFRSEIEAISTEIRRICEDLSPSVLANVGLTAALEWALIDAVSHLPAERKFDYEFICNDELEERLHLDAGVQIQLYRIVQEAVSNVCRHAQARHVRLVVELPESGDLLVSLEDDGCGFKTTKGTRTGRGLNNIRSRASLIEAAVEWHSRPEGGTIFTLRKSSAEKRK
ncbi:MAG: two-component regulator propeller domain-containing protein [Acidobacteriota bacterium]